MLNFKPLIEACWKISLYYSELLKRDSLLGINVVSYKKYVLKWKLLCARLTKQLLLKQLISRHIICNVTQHKIEREKEKEYALHYRAVHKVSDTLCISQKVRPKWKPLCNKLLGNFLDSFMVILNLTLILILVHNSIFWVRKGSDTLWIPCM